MYNAFFEFEKNPFSPKPDRAFFYRSKQHDASLRSLLFTVQSRMGLSSLIGEEGTGKTMLLEYLRDTLESTQTQCAFLRDARTSSGRFFETIASGTGFAMSRNLPYQVFAALHQFTLKQARKGRTVALIVDDAHNLSADVLNEILHLASLHDDKVKLLQTILAGRPQLLPTLDALNLERLKQHAVLSCHLDPFTPAETQNYIEFRLAQAGLPDQTIFPPDALSEIHFRSRGFAPAIHAICEGLLLAAYSARSKVCTPQILDRVFNGTRREESEFEATAGIDRIRLLVAPEPEPPAILTMLLRLEFAAIKTLPPPLPLNANDMLEPLRYALRLMFPSRNYALPVGKFPVGSKKPMRLTDGARNALTLSSITRLVQPQILAISTPTVAISSLVLSQPSILAELRSASQLQRIRPNICPSIGPNKLALFASPSDVLATPIDFASVALQPEISAIEDLKAAKSLLTPKGVNKLSRLSCTVKPKYGILTQAYAEASAVDVPMILGPARPAARFQPIGKGWRRTPLAHLPAFKPNFGILTQAYTEASALDVAAAHLLLHPHAKIQPIGEGWRRTSLSHLPAIKPNSGILRQVDAEVSALDVAAAHLPVHPYAEIQPIGEGWRRTSLSHLPAIEPNSGILRQVDAEVSALDVAAAHLPVHPHAKIQPLGEGWRRTAMAPLPTRPESPATVSKLRNVAPTATQFTGALVHPRNAAGEACSRRAAHFEYALSAGMLSGAQASGRRLNCRCSHQRTIESRLRCALSSTGASRGELTDSRNRSTATRTSPAV